MQVDGLVLVLEREHRLVDLRMRGMVEVLGRDFVQDGVDRVVVEQQCRKHRLLGLEILRRNASPACLHRREIPRVVCACHQVPPGKNLTAVFPARPFRSTLPGSLQAARRAGRVRRRVAATPSGRRHTTRSGASIPGRGCGVEDYSSWSSRSSLVSSGSSTSAWSTGAAPDSRLTSSFTSATTSR